MSACQRTEPRRPDHVKEELTLDNLRSKPSSLCGRCAKYSIINVFNESEVVDTTEHLEYIDSVNHVSNVMNDWIDNRQRHNLVLGPYSSILLRGNCPLCRLIFHIFPTEIEEDAVYYVRPFPSYDRQSSFLKEASEYSKKQYALYFSVECEEGATRNVTNFFADPIGQMINRVWYAFGLSSQNPALDRRALSARATHPYIDYSLCRQWLDECRSKHGITCQRSWSDDLRTSRMIDVEARRIIPCPPNCDYVALSYVWGGVKLEEGALENRKLPQTIEDAIKVTLNLGIQYLWVRSNLVWATECPNS